MFLIGILVIVSSSTAYDWAQTNIPPWNLTNCYIPPVTESCGPDNITDIDDFDTCKTEICNLNVAVILPQNGTLVNIQQVNNTLEELINRTKDIFNITTRYYDDACKQELATVALILAHKAHVILGPVCDYSLASVSRVAKYIGYNGMPVITPGGFTFAYSTEKTNCSHEYYMTVNTGPTDFRSFGEFFYLIMRRYKWRKIALMYDKTEQMEVGGENTCKFVMESVLEEVKYVDYLDYQDGDLVLLGKDYEEYLKEIVGVHYAIILICTSHKKLRDFAIGAYELGMLQKGEYTVFNFETYNNHTNTSMPWWDDEDMERNEIAKKAFKSIFTFTPAAEADFSKVQDSTKRGSIYLDALYDGMLLYASAINKTRQQTNFSITPTGYKVVQNIMGSQFQGKDGNDIKINCNGQRVASYVMLALNSSDQYEIVATYSNENKTINYWKVQWVNGDPRDTPECGYDMSLCRTMDIEKILLFTLISVLCLGILIVGTILYRNFKLKKAIYSMAWKINYDDILFFPKKPRSSFQSSSSMRRGSHSTYIEMIDGISVAGDRQLYTTVGFYKAIRVAVKYLQEAKLELNKRQLIELKAMKDLSHDNLVKFHGACLEIPNVILSEYCAKGSLQDILENEDVKIDNTFKMSLIMDIIRGMNYLHNSVIKSHGALKSTNCLVDSRFVLKITDFGLHFLRKYAHDLEDEESHSYWRRQLWTAPEILRMEHPPPEGTQKGDVYSFAIIMHEIIERKSVFFLETELSPQVLLKSDFKANPR